MPWVPAPAGHDIMAERQPRRNACSRFRIRATLIGPRTNVHLVLRIEAEPRCHAF